MEEEKNIGITVKKSEDMPEWYEQVCLKAELADFAPTKGCMIIRPNGYSIWQSIQDYFNLNIIDETGVRNAYFPLFIPESFFKKEAEHAKGFNPEVAWIDKEVTGASEDRIAVRPTSETIMYDSYAKWIRSYRDLPFKINQWCNIVRWETDATKLFLRSREFLWQEGHCVYETEKECEKETIMYIKMYEDLCRELLALPTLVGLKTEKEKFAGALRTYTIEGFMPDGKALQCGTSHNLGQGFANSFGIRFLGRDKKEHIPWQSSWGLSTRLIGAVIFTHSDDKGLVLPPKLAEFKIVIVPILFEDTKKEVLKKAAELKEELAGYNPIVDDSEDHSPGWKFSEWEMKGIPLRIEIGPKDLKNKSVMVVRRDNSKKESVKLTELKKKITSILDSMHKDLYKKAENFLKESIVTVTRMDDLIKAVNERKLAKTYFCGDMDCEDWIKDKTGGASSRCIPLDSKEPKGRKCVHCPKKATVEIYFSRSY